MPHTREARQFGKGRATILTSGMGIVSVEPTCASLVAPPLDRRCVPRRCKGLDLECGGARGTKYLRGGRARKEASRARARPLEEPRQRLSLTVLALTEPHQDMALPATVFGPGSARAAR